MTIETKTWTCNGCSTEFVGAADAFPPAWKMRGGRLLCDDCSPPARAAARPTPKRPTPAEAVAA